MNNETASHVRAMADKIGQHARQMAHDMSELVNASWTDWQSKMIDQEKAEEKFNALAGHWSEIQSVLTDMTPHMRELFRASRVICEGCGNSYEPQDIEFPEEVKLRDGSTREIALCGAVCFDFWEDTEPGQWVLLVSGPYANKQEVQRAKWTCEVCQGVYDFGLVKLLVDSQDYSDDDQIIKPENFWSGIVCQECEKEKLGRYKTRREMGIYGKEKEN